jgi:hypothetical protein
LLLLTMPPFIAWLRKEQRDLGRIISVFLDDVASGLKLVKMKPSGKP